MSSRSTRSRFSGVVSYLLLAVFAGLGALAAFAIGVDWVRGVDTYSWEPATCEVRSSKLVERPETNDYELEIEYSYVYRGERFESHGYRHGDQGFSELADGERLADRYPAGASVPCWVDPDEPANAWIERANLWSGLWIFVPLIFVGIGVGGIWLLRRFSAATAAGEGRSGEGVKPVAPLKVGVVAAVLFGAFLLFGLGLLVPFFVWPSLRVMEARTWISTECEVLSSGVATHAGDDGSTYSVQVLYRYEVDGREYRSDRYQFLGGSSGGYDSKAEIVGTLSEGARVPCYVDPDDPYEAVIERGFTTEYLFGLIPLLFAGVGLVGLAFTIVGARAVRKSAASPHWRQISEPRGPTGPVDLEQKRGPLGKLGCSIGVALLWNGLLSIFLWVFVEQWREGYFDWFLALFLTPFVLIGLLLLAGIPYSVLALANPRVRAKLGRSAIPAGESGQIDWSFDGRASRLRRVHIWLECSRTRTETTVHERGQSTRTHTDVVATIEIHEREAPAPLERGSASFTVPEDAPPSSRSAEAITWTLKLQGEISWWPDVLEEFEIKILPPS